MKKLKWVSPDEVVVKQNILYAKDKQIEYLAKAASIYKSHDRMQNKILIAFVLVCIVAALAEYFREKKKS